MAPNTPTETVPSELLDQYISFKNQAAKLQQQIDELKPMVATYVLGRGGQLLYKDVRLSTHVSRTWDFSNEIALLEKSIKEKKQQEIQGGKAKLRTETLFVTMQFKRSQTRRQDKPTQVREDRKGYDVSGLRKTHSRAYAPWGADEDDFLVRQFHDGYSVGEISKALERQQSAIRSRLRKLGEIH
jgi:hypothetical protein